MKKNYISNKDESARMFKSSFLEAFTKVHWSVPLFVFIPFIGYLFYTSWTLGGLSMGMYLLWILAGLFVWSVSEYVLHRFVFHQELPGKLGARIHFIIHGVHHDYPNDSKRLVMPPALSLPLAYLFYVLFYSIVEGAAFYPFFIGFLIGYLCYDMLHYAIHHAPMKGKIWMALKTHHLKHHFKDPHNGYGVSSPVWDVIVGTQFSNNKEKSS